MLVVLIVESEISVDTGEGSLATLAHPESETTETPITANRKIIFVIDQSKSLQIELAS